MFSLNEHRRHLTADQRAAIAADLASWTLGRNQHSKEGPSIDGPSPSVSVAEAAAIAGVSERSVERAKATKRAAPDLHEQVRAGKLKASEARAKAAAHKPKAPRRPDDAKDRQWKVDRDAVVNALTVYRTGHSAKALAALVRKQVPEVEAVASPLQDDGRSVEELEAEMEARFGAYLKAAGSSAAAALAQRLHERACAWTGGVMSARLHGHRWASGRRLVRLATLRRLLASLEA